MDATKPPSVATPVSAAPPLASPVVDEENTNESEEVSPKKSPVISSASKTTESVAKKPNTAMEEDSKASGVPDSDDKKCSPKVNDAPTVANSPPPPPSSSDNGKIENPTPPTAAFQTPPVSSTDATSQPKAEDATKSKNGEPMEVESTAASSKEATDVRHKRRSLRARKQTPTKQTPKRKVATNKKRAVRPRKQRQASTRKEFLKRAVAKDFPDKDSGKQQIYFGTVVSVDDGFWSIEYQDGDTEEMERAELEEAMALHKRVMKDKHKFYLADEFMEDSSDDDPPPGSAETKTKPKRTPRKKSSRKAMTQATVEVTMPRRLSRRLSETKASLPRRQSLRLSETKTPPRSARKAKIQATEKVRALRSEAGTKSKPRTRPTEKVKFRKHVGFDDGTDLLQHRVAKEFGMKVYFGSVAAYNPPEGSDEELFHIEYDDGDNEDFSREDLLIALGLYEALTSKSRGQPRAALYDLYPRLPQLDSQIGQEFVHYLHYRMVKWLLRYPSKLNETVLDKLPDPYRPDSDVLAWKLLDCCSTGNAYRHLDTQTTTMGKMIRIKLAGDESSNPDTWSADQVKDALTMCLLQMAGFRDDICIQANPETATCDCPYPSNEKELKGLVKHLEKLSKQEKPPTVFNWGHQTQGFRWIAYLKRWKPETLAKVVEGIREAATWKGAVDVICSLPGVGPYYGTQGLCTLFMGVWKYDSSLFTKHPKEVLAGMREETGAGPGPHSAIKAIFPGGIDFAHGLRELQRLIPQEMTRLGLEFPYLKDAAEDEQRRPMSCVDLEHSLCYFQRYLLSKKSLKKPGIDRLFGRFQENPELKKKGIRPIFALENLREGRVDSYCDRLLGDGDETK